MTEQASDAPATERRWDCIALLAVLAAVVALQAMGRPWWCACRQLALWASDINSRHCSQHLADPYSFTHVLHGFVFYALLWLALRRRAGPRARLGLALVLEVGWEVLENTDRIIDRYRTATIGLDYYGDSIVNSIADIALCALGYVLVRRLPVWASLLLFAAVELALLAAIRDNLTLNVLMLTFPIEAVKTWQGGG